MRMVSKRLSETAPRGENFAGKGCLVYRKIFLILVQCALLLAAGKLMASYNSVPFVAKVEANLEDYVVAKGMDGVFFYLAREEAAIRQNPAARTTDLLRRVFGK